MMRLKWWQKSVFYQIYPRSFADGNGDGIGDLSGITARLDYLADLGIDAIWLSPHYPSPLFDCGYDISDYTGVAREYGTLEDFKTFLDESHQRGIRVILDLVLNHTSEEHPWFIESRSSRDNPKRDWYVWKDGQDGGPPNNWNSSFGGPAWEYDAITGQYYYHYFFKEQPDLNWRNPEVKQAMWNAVRFWLELGVDGYRLDATGTIFEDPSFQNHTVDIPLAELRKLMDTAKTEREQKHYLRQWKLMFQHQVVQPGLHELMKELRSVVDEYDDRMLIAEADQVSYHGSGDDEIHMVFNFPLMRTLRLTPESIRLNQATRLQELHAISPDAWPCNTLGNHDSPRVYNRFGDGEHNWQIAHLSLALMLTLKGTPFLYNGEEIGMSDLYLTDIDLFRDMIGVWYYRAQIEELGISPAEALERAAIYTRDKNRTPMQWSNTPNGGFCPADVDPWLPVNPDYAQGINVDEQQNDSTSLLSFYRRFLHFRKRTPALIEGDYLPVTEPGSQPEQVLCFLRRASGQTCLVALNYSPEPQTLRLTTLGPGTLRGLFSSHQRSGERDNLNRLELAPFEAYIAEIGGLVTS